MIRFCAFILVLSWAVPLSAHEFWIEPEKFSVPVGTKVSFSLLRGEYFTGEVMAINAERVAALRHYSVGGTVDQLKRVPSARFRLESLSLTFDRPGTHLIVEDSTPSALTLPPDKFVAYLQEEGLEFVTAARKRANQEDQPGRELYSRCVKTLIQVGNHNDATYATRTGQRLEIVPQSNPFDARPGAALSFQVYFDGQPLEASLVRAWHYRGKDLVVLKGRSDGEGRVSFELADAGPWMISVVHMIPLSNEPGYDWQSYWGNLTFELFR